MAEVHASVIVNQVKVDESQSAYEFLADANENQPSVNLNESELQGSFVDIAELENGDPYRYMLDDDNEIRGKDESSVSESLGEAATISSHHKGSEADSTSTKTSVTLSRSIETNVSDLTCPGGSEVAPCTSQQSTRNEDQAIRISSPIAKTHERERGMEPFRQSNSKRRLFILRRRSCESLDSVPEDREAIPGQSLFDSRSSLSTLSTWSSFRGSFRMGKKKPKKQAGNDGTLKHSSPFPCFVRRVLYPGKDTRWDLQENESSSLQSRSTVPPSRPTRPPSSPTNSPMHHDSIQELLPTKIEIVPPFANDNNESGITCDTSSLKREELEHALEFAGITSDMVEKLKQSGYQITECT